MFVAGELGDAVAGAFSFEAGPETVAFTFGGGSGVADPCVWMCGWRWEEGEDGVRRGG